MIRVIKIALLVLHFVFSSLIPNCKHPKSNARLDFRQGIKNYLNTTTDRGMFWDNTVYLMYISYVNFT